MKDLFKESEVESFVKLFANKTTEKLKENLLDSFYSEVQDYLYQHYDNIKAKIQGELIGEITEEYIKNPTDYKFKKLREKMFLENKDTLTKVLTDEAIFESVENVIEQYTHRNYHFEWRWKDGIARFILENFDLFKNDERVNSWIGRQLENKDNRIKYLESKIEESKCANCLDW